MERKPIEESDFDETGCSYTLSLIAGKYKPVILKTSVTPRVPFRVSA